MKDQVELDGLQVFPKKLVTLRSSQRRNRYMDISPKKTQPNKSPAKVSKPPAKVTKRSKKVMLDPHVSNKNTKSNTKKPPGKVPKTQPKKRSREEERVVVSPIPGRPRRAKAKALERDN